MWYLFDSNSPQVQLVSIITRIPLPNLIALIKLDELSVLFILLTTFLMPLCLFMSPSLELKNVKAYLVAFIFLEILLILVFSLRALIIF